MEQIIVTVQDQAKAALLKQFLAALDFIHSIDTVINDESEDAERADDSDFFAGAGLWADRDIHIDDLRRQAWPRQAP